MSTGVQSCEIVLPGYTLVERIGTGGYAEVWRAEAPGGLQKAVKIVYGYYDDEFASQELKALERVKGVRHPFLLSLERFEVINGRLAILTELADMSLDQRLRQCLSEGLAGIPRDELLRYAADAAEALDYLSQRHSLLHLDVKPENLLVLGDHIKVADFGLVKELASRTQNSLVSGMTPTYASPEMFDDAPSAASDQYSLAIVFQEMLTGKLPFPGRTAAQLAKQHTQAEPQLMPLPAQDRPIVARALAKQPADRYPSCRAFVDALLGRREAPVARAPSESPWPIVPAHEEPASDETKSPSFCATIRVGQEKAPERPGDTFTQPISRSASPALAPESEADLAPEPWVPEETVDVAVPAPNDHHRCDQPTLYIAIGGVGIQALCRLRALLSTNGKLDTEGQSTAAIAFDTNRDELREACSSRWKAPLSPDDTLHIPLRLPSNYDNAREFLGWVSRRWLYNIPRSLETRGYRPLGRIALVDHSRRVLALVDSKLQRLSAAGSNDTGSETHDATIQVILLAGTGGGTGAGTVIDVANAVRSQAAARNLRVEVQGMLICPSLAMNNSTALPAANTYSLLTELNHATLHGNRSNSASGNTTQPFESSDSPFDHVYCLPAHGRSNNEKPTDNLDLVAKYLALEALPDSRAAIRACRSTPTPREMRNGRALLLRKFGYASLTDQMEACLGELATDLAAAVKAHWINIDRSENWPRLVDEENQAASVPQLEAASPDDGQAVRAVVPRNDATPLALRGRFEESLSTEFASEVLRQVQRRSESRDERGRPVITARDGKQIVDWSRDAIRSIITGADASMKRGAGFASQPALRVLIAMGSERTLRGAVEAYDPRQHERPPMIETIDQLLQTECVGILKEGLQDPSIATALSVLIDSNQLVSRAIKQSTTALLQCGSDRRTLILAPKNDPNGAASEQIRAARPLAAVIAADVRGTLVVSEDSGISPRSLAICFEQLFPGIATAAGRLVTRTDIAWQSIRSSPQPNT